MKPNAFVLLLSVTTAHPQGTLERYGAGGSIIERFRSDNGRRQIPIVDGHPYTVPAPATEGRAPRVYSSPPQRSGDVRKWAMSLG